jgi:ABC-type uncharacterized transport system substrate-binding protein
MIVPKFVVSRSHHTQTETCDPSAKDPTRLGLVTSLARPSGNLTGINILSNELEAKRLHLLHQLMPQAQRIAVLVNPGSVAAETTLRDVEAGAPTLGLQLQVLKANTARGLREMCADLSAFGGKADIQGCAASIPSVANDPSATSARNFCCDAHQRSCATAW